MQTPMVPSSALQRFCAALFEAEGVPPAEAALTATILVEADLTGVASHGVSRVQAYMRRLREGGCRRVAHVEVLRDVPAGALWDACGSLGQVVAQRAMTRAIEKARETGVGLVSVRNINHTGANAWYARMAAEAGLFGLVAGNGPPMMAPWGSATAVFSTNPLSFGVPAGHKRPCMVADMATSVSARGNILLAARDGTPIPAGWAMDAEGNDTTDPVAALKGALINFGGHKGYAVALMVEVLAGLLSGAGYGPQLGEMRPDVPVKSGGFFAAVNVGMLTDLDSFRSQVDGLAEAVTTGRKRPGVDAILLPGDRERERRDHALIHGLALSETVRSELVAEGERYGVAFPSSGKEHEDLHAPVTQ